jgi:hypothetical protein
VTGADRHSQQQQGGQVWSAGACRGDVASQLTKALQTSYNKDVLICDEMERKPSWNLGEIKSMATGGWMSIPVKFGDPVFMRWRAPVIISSNYKVPEWGGGGNDVYALVRRFAPFPFPHTVARPDPNMPTQLQVSLHTRCVCNSHQSPAGSRARPHLCYVSALLRLDRHLCWQLGV